ncbi:myrosinase 1-like [Eurosta solidaginis]|uniref:myrosinase 1-like n=1 Tax=Eurosta solidaginis TaxID=178769 RepID=UPI0035306F6C
MKVLFITFYSLALFCTALAQDKECYQGHKGGSTSFPKSFNYGVATSAYQIEGGWNADGKAQSIWDNYTHTYPERIADRSNGDDAAESYSRVEQDIEALKKLKVNFYRFSISWSRVLPEVTTKKKNRKGITYYNKLIDLLIANNIKPMVTMFHYDMPQELNQYNGFMNSTIIDYFVSYADFLFKTFGDRVKLWITHNEPYVFCSKGYGEAAYPPLVHSPGVGHYICMDHVLKSHAMAYRKYQKKYLKEQRGRVGIAIDTGFYYLENLTIPYEAVERGIQYNLGWLAEPIFGKTGNYPALMRADIERNSLKEGSSESRLPVLSKKWQNIIKGSADFMGINYFGATYVDIPASPVFEIPSYGYDSNIIQYPDASWRRALSNWLYCVPEGLEDLLKWIRDNYNNVEVMITENGWSTDNRLNDSERIDYIKAHLQAVLNVINEGCNVTHYTYWTLFDNFEWNMGYTEKFGLFSVDMADKDKKRVMRDSAKYYAKAIESRKVPELEVDS